LFVVGGRANIETEVKNGLLKFDTVEEVEVIGNMGLNTGESRRSEAEALGFGGVEVEVGSMGDDEKDASALPQGFEEVGGGNGDVIAKGAGDRVPWRDARSDEADDRVKGEGKEDHGQRAALFDAGGEENDEAGRGKTTVDKESVLVVVVELHNGIDEEKRKTKMGQHPEEIATGKRGEGGTKVEGNDASKGNIPHGIPEGLGLDIEDVVDHLTALDTTLGVVDGGGGKGRGRQCQESGNDFVVGIAGGDGAGFVGRARIAGGRVQRRSAFSGGKEEGVVEIAIRRNRVAIAERVFVKKIERVPDLRRSIEPGGIAQAVGARSGVVGLGKKVDVVVVGGFPVVESRWDWMDMRK
jgi:hypothetical protein